jgi:hypothetical protein
MIKFLNAFSWIALAGVSLSFPAYGAFGFVPLLFCDYGPASRCLATAATIWGVPFVQAVFLIVSWLLLKTNKYVFISAGLMILSVLPLALFGLLLSGRYPG